MKRFFLLMALMMQPLICADLSDQIKTLHTSLGELKTKLSALQAGLDKIKKRLSGEKDEDEGIAEHIEILKNFIAIDHGMGSSRQAARFEDPETKKSLLAIIEHGDKEENFDILFKLFNDFKFKSLLYAGSLSGTYDAIANEVTEKITDFFLAALDISSIRKDSSKMQSLEGAIHDIFKEIPDLRQHLQHLLENVLKKMHTISNDEKYDEKIEALEQEKKSVETTIKTLEKELEDKISDKALFKQKKEALHQAIKNLEKERDEKKGSIKTQELIDKRVRQLASLEVCQSGQKHYNAAYVSKINNLLKAIDHLKAFDHGKVDKEKKVNKDLVQLGNLFKTLADICHRYKALLPHITNDELNEVVCFADDAVYKTLMHKEDSAGIFSAIRSNTNVEYSDMRFIALLIGGLLRIDDAVFTGVGGRKINEDFLKNQAFLQLTADKSKLIRLYLLAESGLAADAAFATEQKEIDAIVVKLNREDFEDAIAEAYLKWKPYGIYEKDIKAKVKEKGDKKTEGLKKKAADDIHAEINLEYDEKLKALRLIFEEEIAQKIAPKDKSFTEIKLKEAREHLISIDVELLKVKTGLIGFAKPTKSSIEEDKAIIEGYQKNGWPKFQPSSQASITGLGELETAESVYTVNLSLVIGSIVEQRFENGYRSALVIATDEIMSAGGGISRDLHEAAGKIDDTDPIRNVYLAEVGEYQKCPKGSARITPSFNLSKEANAASWFLHTTGPKPKETLNDFEKAKGLLKLCYENCLNLASINGIEHVTFCGIATGTYGFPVDESIPFAIETIVTWLKEHKKKFKEIRIFVWDGWDKAKTPPQKSVGKFKKSKECYPADMYGLYKEALDKQGAIEKSIYESKNLYADIKKEYGLLANGNLSNPREQYFEPRIFELKI